MGNAEFAERNVIAIDLVESIGISHRRKNDLSEINTRFLPAKQRRNGAAKVLAEQNHCVIARFAVEAVKSVLWELVLRFERRIQLCGTCSNRARGQTDSATSSITISGCCCTTWCFGITFERHRRSAATSSNDLDKPFTLGSAAKTI